jgi:hypothetical protein
MRFAILAQTQTKGGFDMGFLVSDGLHVPVAFFDEHEDAIAYVCSRHNVATRFVTTETIGATFEVVLHEKKPLGYIRDGVEFNPKFIKR